MALVFPLFPLIISSVVLSKSGFGGTNKMLVPKDEKCIPCWKPFLLSLVVSCTNWMLIDYGHS